VLFSAVDDLEQTVSDYVPLHKGFNAIRIDYRSLPTGAARLRLLWLADPRDSGLTGNRPLEPLPPTVLSHRGDDAELTAATALRRGRELFVTGRCDKCHQAVPVDAQLALDAPHLGGLERRLTPEWVAAWLREPQRLRNHITMPAMLAGLNEEAQAQAAADVTAWLFSPVNAGVATQEESPTVMGEPSAGEVLWEDLGCIVCHHFRAPSAADEYDRTSLHFAASKYTPEGLHDFLQQPHARYRWSRMPDFRLSPEEAAHLAAYIRQSASGRIDATPAQPGGNLENGRKQYAALGCGNCHQVADRNAPTATRPPANLFAGDPPRGCLTAAPRSGVPAYALTDEDRRALAAFLTSGRDSPQRPAPAEDTAQFVSQLRCTACHDRDAARSPRRLIVAADGRRGIAPDNLPSLTWTGEKLHQDWTARLLSGRLEERMRPWQPARMPAFPAYAQILTAGLVAQHGLAAGSEADFEPEPQLAEFGRQLTLPATLDCRQCHGVGSEQPRGDDRTQIALGINLAHTRERLRHDYYRRFVLDPPRYDINTRMPRFAATDGTTRVKSILGGDAPAQFEAVWHYIQSVPGERPAAGGGQTRRDTP
jgi:mono/diheme cytochrome c family protein